MAANEQEQQEQTLSINYHVEKYLQGKGPIEVVLSGEDENGNRQTVDSFSVDPDNDFPDHIRRKLTANATERLGSGRVSQYSNEGNQFRFEKLRDEVIPMWEQGVWSPRKRSPRLEYQAVAEVYNLPVAKVKAAAKREGREKFNKVLEQPKVQEKLLELQAEGGEDDSAEDISFDSLLGSE